MSYKSDIQATFGNAAGTDVIIAPSVRLRAISICADTGAGDGLLELTTTSNAGTILYKVEVIDGTNYTLNFPEDGIPFPKGIYCKTLTNIISFTLFTDKYNAPGLTAGS